MSTWGPRAASRWPGPWIEASGTAGTPVVLISTHAEDEYAELIEASPAVGFVSKSSMSGAAIRALLEGVR